MRQIKSWADYTCNVQNLTKWSKEKTQVIPPMEGLIQNSRCLLQMPSEKDISTTIKLHLSIPENNKHCTNEQILVEFISAMGKNNGSNHTTVSPCKYYCHFCKPIMTCGFHFSSSEFWEFLCPDNEADSDRDTHDQREARQTKKSGGKRKNLWVCS